LTAAEFVARFAEGWQRPKPDGFLDYFRPLFHPDAYLRQPTLPPASGLAEVEERFRELFALFPDYVVTVDNWAASGDLVWIGVTHHATIGRRRASWRGADRVVIEGGQIRERIAFFDSLATIPATLAAPGTWPTLVRWNLRTRRAG
jgi:hypothetical protein